VLLTKPHDRHRRCQLLKVCSPGVLPVAGRSEGALSPLRAVYFVRHWQRQPDHQQGNPEATDRYDDDSGFRQRPRLCQLGIVMPKSMSRFRNRADEATPSSLLTRPSNLVAWCTASARLPSAT
jgi:hypothetical protein